MDGGQQPFDNAALRRRLTQVGERIGAREANEREALAEARRRAEVLHGLVADGLEAFHQAASEAGAPHVAVEISELRPDDKHLHSIQFSVARGRHAAVVTVKSRGETTLVGPFKAGKKEGPCLSFAFAEQGELEKALGDFLERFLEQAATP